MSLALPTTNISNVQRIQNVSIHINDYLLHTQTLSNENKTSNCLYTTPY